MCGRFAFIPDLNHLGPRYQLDQIPTLPFQYNISPSAPVLLLGHDGRRYVPMVMKWGFIPSLNKEISPENSFIQAQAETLFESPVFKEAARMRRGIILMNGFYQWRKNCGSKQPFYISRYDKDYLAVAAIWETVTSATQVISSCAMITTAANSLVTPLHERMPLILSPALQAVWLDNNYQEEQALKSVLHPYQGEDLIAYPVTADINDVSFQERRAMEPLLSK